MAWANFIASLESLFLGLAGVVSLLGVLVFSGLGIFIFLKSSKEKDEKKKLSLKKWGVFLLELPWFLIVVFLVYWIVSQIFQFYK